MSTLIQERIVNTLRLMGPALLLSILIALARDGGSRSAIFVAGSLGQLMRLSGSRSPSLVRADVDSVFAVWLALFPVSGCEPGLGRLAIRSGTVLPVTVCPEHRYVGRWLRYPAGVDVEVIKQDYIRTACEGRA